MMGYGCLYFPAVRAGSARIRRRVEMVGDEYLMTFAVTYRDADGMLRTKAVQAHNDELDRDDDEADPEGDTHYKLWRYLANGRRVNVFRCQRDVWDSTAVVPGVPPTLEEVAEMDALRRENAQMQDRLHVSEARAAQMEARAAQAQHEAASLRGRVKQLEPPF